MSLYFFENTHQFSRFDKIQNNSREKQEYDSLRSKNPSETPFYFCYGEWQCLLHCDCGEARTNRGGKLGNLFGPKHSALTHTQREHSLLAGFARPAELYSARFSWQKF